MSDEASPQAASLPSPVELKQSSPEVAEVPEVTDPEVTNGTFSTDNSEPKEVATDAPVKITELESTNNNQSTVKDLTTHSPEATQEKEDFEMEDNTKPGDAALAADDESIEPSVDTPASGSKSKAPRRKSGGVPEHKKKLNKKASRVKMTHTDAKPGDHFYIRLKGYPLWPGIVCEESMLPPALLKSRPVTAAQPDGTYREDYQDGGPKVKDRTFGVMYLSTNEFGWIPNYDLVELNFDNVATTQTNMRKDLAVAHQLAAERHDLAYYRNELENFVKDKKAAEEAKEANRLAKKEKAKNDKQKRKSALKVAKEDDDTEMLDVAPDADEEADPAISKVKNGKKRSLPESDANASEPSKKVKVNLKLNTPKAANGTSTPKTAKDGSSTKSKPRTKKAKIAATPETVVPKEPELTAEEKRAKKEKEILFLRHKLQKGLLTRDQDPKENEMKQMSEFVSKLEGYADLEVSIIRATKINKVLKAILKLPMIPKEEELRFKPRSQTLLDKWNKLLASEQGTPITTAPPAATNGASADAKTEGEENKASPVESTNDAQEPVAEELADEIVEEKTQVIEPSVSEEAKDVPVVSAAAPFAEDAPKESIAEPTPVESTA